MNLIIDGNLACPPSETYSFGTICLFASIKKYDILVEVPWDYRDFYYSWLKKHYLLDHVCDIIKEGEERGRRVFADRLTCENIWRVLESI